MMFRCGDRAAFTVVGAAALLLSTACAHRENPAPKNSLHQHTGEAGSTIPKSRPPYYPNTAGNIVAPPGNPGGNDAGAPPIVGGTENQAGGWPKGR
jgi:hypothetical protein